jgi:hypothetical protein
VTITTAGKGRLSEFMSMAQTNIVLILHSFFNKSATHPKGEINNDLKINLMIKFKQIILNKARVCILVIDVDVMKIYAFHCLDVLFVCLFGVTQAIIQLSGDCHHYQ